MFPKQTVKEKSQSSIELLWHEMTWVKKSVSALTEAVGMTTCNLVHHGGNVTPKWHDIIMPWKHIRLHLNVSSPLWTHPFWLRWGHLREIFLPDTWIEESLILLRRRKRVAGSNLSSSWDCKCKWVISALLHHQYHDWGETFEQGTKLLPGHRSNNKKWLPTAPGVRDHCCVCVMG